MEIIQAIFMGIAAVFVAILITASIILFIITAIKETKSIFNEFKRVLSYLRSKL